MIDAGKRNNSNKSFSAALRQIKPGVELIFALDSGWLAKNVEKETDAKNPLLAPLSPLWNRTSAIALSIDVQDDLSANVAIQCESSDATGEVLESASATIKVAREAIKNLRRRLAQGPTSDLLLLLDPADQLLSSAQTRREGSMVYLESKVALDLVRFFGMNVWAIVTARGTAHKAKCSDNLRSIVLAMHLYAEKHGTLPPATVYDDAGKPMHSWRVLLLPYLEQEDLYKQYRFDEPWDGPNNRKLIDEMPDIYRCPSGTHAAGHTHYAVMVGEHTPFPPGAKKGHRLDDFPNGTTNTILLSEISASSELKIPWTKPQDVTLTEESIKPGSPKGFSSNHDGGFNAAYADASVRFIRLDVDQVRWRKALRRD